MFYEEVDREIVDLLIDVTGTEIVVEEGEVNVNMCKAIEDMKQDAADERAIKIAKALLISGKESVESISEFTDLPVDVIEGLIES